MNAESLQRFADDMRCLTGLVVETRISFDSDGLHTVRINGKDFFFRADGSGYDGWGKALVPGFPL